jgi:hypothetical protein
LLVFRSDVIGSDNFRRKRFGRAPCAGGIGLAEELLGKTGAGGGRQTQGHLAVRRASGDNRVPDIGIGGGQRLGRNFKGVG